MALDTSMSSRWFDRSGHSTDFVSDKSTAHLKDHIDKQAARKAAQEYGLRASQRNRAAQRQRANANGRQKKRTNRASTKQIKTESSLHQESQAEVREMPNTSTGHRGEPLMKETTEQKDNRDRQQDMSRVMDWVQETSKLSIAERTLHSLPNDTSVGDKNSMYESLKDVGADRAAVLLNSSENVLKEGASAEVVIQRAGSDKQSGLGCDKKSTATRKSNSRSGSRELTGDRNKDKNRNCLMDDKEEDEALTIESPDSMAIKRRIQNLKKTRNSLLAERRVLWLRIEEVRLRREVRELARDVAKARTKLTALTSQEQKENQRNHEKDDIVSQEEEEEAEEKQRESQQLRLKDAAPKKVLQQSETLGEITIDEASPEQGDSRGPKKEDRNLDLIPVRTPYKSSKQLEDNLSAKVDTRFSPQPKSTRDPLAVEIDEEGVLCDAKAEVETNLGNAQTLEVTTPKKSTVKHTLNTSPEKELTAAASSSSGMFAELGSCSKGSGEFRVGKDSSQTVGYVTGATVSSNFSSIVDTEKFCPVGDTPVEKDETLSYPLRDIQVYYRTKKDSSSAPAGLLNFGLNEDHISFAKSSSHDGMEMLSAGDEQGDTELTCIFRVNFIANIKLFVEEMERMVGNRSDLNATESCKEEKQESNVSRSSGASSFISLEDEAEFALLPDCIPKATTINEETETGNVDKTQSTQSDVDSDLQDDSRDDQPIDCSFTETNENESQKGRSEEKSPATLSPLGSLFKDVWPEHSPKKSQEQASKAQTSSAVFFPSTRTTTSGPRSPTDTPSPVSGASVQCSNQSLTEANGSTSSETMSPLSVHTTSEMTSCISPCVRGFSRTNAEYVQELVAHFIRAFADPIFPDHLLEDQLPLSLDVFFRVEKELGNSYIQEAFDRAVFDSVNKRLRDIYGCCGRLKKEEYASMDESSWEVPAVSYFMEDVQKTILKMTDCNAHPFASYTFKENIIEELLQQDAKRFGKHDLPFQRVFPASSSTHQTAF